MEFDYLPADHFPESPNFTVIDHGLQDTGDVAWWPLMMAIYDPNFSKARELPLDVAIVTAQGPLSLTKLEEKMGPAIFIDTGNRRSDEIVRLVLKVRF